MFVKQSLHVTSTPNAPKTEIQSSEENTGNVYIYKVILTYINRRKFLHIETPQKGGQSYGV
jgi:hypothetical protein